MKQYTTKPFHSSQLCTYTIYIERKKVYRQWSTWDLFARAIQTNSQVPINWTLISNILLCGTPYITTVYVFAHTSYTIKRYSLQCVWYVHCTAALLQNYNKIKYNTFPYGFSYRSVYGLVIHRGFMQKWKWISEF